MRQRLLRLVTIEGDICIVTLSQGQVAICDSVDYPRVAPHNWCARRSHRTFYAITNVGSRSCYLHRSLLNLTDPDIEVDHKDGDGLNNRRFNLRTCSKHENQMNSKLQLRSFSGFKGVSWNESTKKWQTYIVVNGEQKYLGLFDTKEEAAQAYNEASFRYHGDFGKRNKI